VELTYQSGTTTRFVEDARDLFTVVAMVMETGLKIKRIANEGVKVLKKDNNHL